jgi:hypothetical protein
MSTETTGGPFSTGSLKLNLTPPRSLCFSGLMEVYKTFTSKKKKSTLFVYQTCTEMFFACVLKDLAVPQLGMVQLLSWDLLESTKMEVAFTSINVPGIKVLT